jgi:hypothetical protein
MFASFSEIHWEATRVVTEGPNAALEFQVEATNSAPILSPAGMIPATGKRITLQGVSLFKLNERARSLRSGGTSTPAASSPARAWRVDGCQARPKFLSGAVQAVETITLHFWRCCLAGCICAAFHSPRPSAGASSRPAFGSPQYR